MDQSRAAAAQRLAAGQLENYQQKLFCDVILTAVGERETTNAASSSGHNPPAYSEAISQSDIYCHRSVLSSHSSYFKTILSTEIRSDGNQVKKRQLSGNAYGMVVKEQGEKMVKIVLKDFQPHFLKPIVDYIYSGSIVLTFRNVKQIYEYAKKLMIDSLIEECERFLDQPINASNCLDLMVCAHELKRVNVEEKAVEYFTKNIKKVFSKINEGFKDVPLGVMEKLMMSGKTDAGNAEEIFQALIIWAEADKNNRLQHLQKLMEPNIGLLSHNFLLNFLADTDVVSSDLRLMKLVISTMKMKQLSLSVPSTSNTVMSSSAPQSSLSGQSDQSEEKTLLVLTGVHGGNGNGVHEKLDRGSNTWSEWMTKEIPTGFGVAVLREILFVIGGVTPQENKRTVQIYNFSQQKWTPGPNLNLPRVYVCGGRDKPDDETCTVYSSVEEYDLKTKQWRKRSDMKEARLNFGIATHQNMIYVFGGWRDMRNLNTCERYDPSSDTWQYICSLPSPRQSPTVGVLGDKIHIIGAYNGGKGSNTTEVYDVEQNEFSTGPNLNHAANFPKCVVVKKKYLK